MGLIFNGNGDVIRAVDGSLTVEGLDFGGISNVNAGIGTFSGNLNVGGVLTYEDVKNVDSVGIVTARTGVKVLAGGLNVVGASYFNNNIVATASTATSVTVTDESSDTLTFPLFVTGSVSGGLVQTENLQPQAGSNFYFNSSTGALNATSINGNIVGGTVSGTTGTFTGDVDIADKIIHTGDTNTAIRFPAADTITAETGGSERLRITSDGKIGINESNPACYGIHADYSGTSESVYWRADTGAGNITAIYGAAGALGQGLLGTTSAHALAFYANNAERYRITTSGTHVFGGNTAAPIVDNGEFLYRGNSTSTFESLPQSLYAYGDSLGSGSANAGTGLLFGGKYHTNGSITTFAGIHGIKENTTSDEYGGALVFGVRQNAASSWERLRIKSDGKISIDKGVTALLTPSQTTAATIGGGNMTGGSSWFNHTNTADYYGVDGDHKLTNGTTYGKITARNTDAAITNDATGGHVYFLIAKTVGGTLGNSNWKVENVAGWKMKWPSSLAAGATTTFYMRDAVESFGSPTVPDSGDYYIAWFFSTSQDMGTRGSSWFVDDTSTGKIYYHNPSSDLSNPGQHIPSHNDSWDGTMTGEKIHFRYETLPVADLTGTILKSPFLVDPIMQGTPTYDGHPMTGGSLVKWVEWDSNTASIEYSSASFTDSAYLIHYNLTGNPGWYQTRFQFMNADKTVFGDSDHYISHCEWLHAAGTSSSLNSNVNASAGTAGSIWLCGNGTNYGHAGWVWVIPSNIRHNFSSTLTNNWQASSVGSDEINHFLVRGHSYLTIGNQPSTAYREEGGGQTRFGGYNVSGFRIYGCNSSSNNGPDSNGSHNGWVSIYRYKRGV